MTHEDVFERWCPSSNRWSVWAKPSLFTRLLPLENTSSLREPIEAIDLSWFSAVPAGMALVIDLPGDEALVTGLALSRCGYQPVPLFNCCAELTHEVLPTATIRDYLVRGTFHLPDPPLPDTAPPAFLLDSDRVAGKNAPHPGAFDNRWMTFPQDFPSATFLKETGIHHVLLLQKNTGQPALDLAQVLMRWQEAGLVISSVDATRPQAPQVLTVTPPPRYRWFFQRALALLGFRRNSAGGFGSVIPDPTSGAG